MDEFDFLLAIGPYNISRYSNQLSPFNAADHWEAPYFTKEQTLGLFEDLQRTCGLELENGIVLISDICSKWCTVDAMNAKVKEERFATFLMHMLSTSDSMRGNRVVVSSPLVRAILLKSVTSKQQPTHLDIPGKQSRFVGCSSSHGVCLRKFFYPFTDRCLHV